jgi:hypothetical protein
MCRNNFVQDAALTGTVTHSRGNRRGKPSTSVAVIALCLVLLMLLAVAHVTHAHSSDHDADHCPLCIAMHSVLPFIVMMVAVHLVRVRIAATALLEVRSITRYWHFTLFNRPPPAGC